MKLTPNQVEAMLYLNQYVGRTVLVLTSGYTANVAPQAVRDSVATVSSAALRGLEAKGLLKVDAFWKGANVTVLKAYDFVEESRAAREAAPAPAAKPKPVVARMARYEAAYRALHGRTVSVTWDGEKVRVLEHGGDPAYCLRFDADELDRLSERMENKVAEDAARRAAAGGFENLGDIFAEMEDAALAEAKAETARDAARFAALSPAEQAAEVAAIEAKREAWADKFDVADLGDDEEDEEDADGDDEEESEA